LACTIPFTLLLSFLTRFVSGESPAPESAKLLADILKILSGGIFGVIAGVGIRKEKKDD